MSTRKPQSNNKIERGVAIILWIISLLTTLAYYFCFTQKDIVVLLLIVIFIILGTVLYLSSAKGLINEKSRPVRSKIFMVMSLLLFGAMIVLLINTAVVISGSLESQRDVLIGFAIMGLLPAIITLATGAISFLVISVKLRKSK